MREKIFKIKNSGHQIFRMIIGLSAGMLMVTAPLFSTATYTWVGSTDDLNTDTNWEGGVVGMVPGADDVAVFDNSIPGVSLTPSATETFKVAVFNFLDSAQAFSFSFDNCTFSLNETGSCITGAQTNTTITATNTDNSTHFPGNQISIITSNSTGSAIINAVNSGHASGSTHNATISKVSTSGTNHQIETTASIISIDDGWQYNASNIGVASTTGTGHNSVGYVTGSQLQIKALVVDDNVTLSASTSGTNSGSDNRNNIGYVGTSQINVLGPVVAGDYLTLIATNVGNDTSTGSGNNQVGYINNNQIQLYGNSQIGNNATVTLGNIGTNSNSGTSNHVGFLHNGQFAASTFSAQDFFNVSATNSGIDTGAIGSSNTIGYVTDNQMGFDESCLVRHYSAITVSNNGTSSRHGNNNSVGYVKQSQFSVASSFHGGNYLNISASNSGTITETIGTNNKIGVIQSNQLEFDSTCDVGNNATIIASNTGNGNVGGNFVGNVQGSQLALGGNFIAGPNLIINLTNSTSNSDTIPGVAKIDGSQLSCNGVCTLGDGSVITASNSRNAQVGAGQILFNQGLAITSGQVTIHAINHGSLTGPSIGIYGGLTGGDTNIILENGLLDISTSTASYTIGALNGDSPSFAQCAAPLYISTDPSVNANFAGTISDYPLSMTPTQLFKTGLGTQKLSGNNSYTGLTTVEQGTLILAGSILRDIDVSPSGVLGGTGTVGGDLTNAGTISPGESIGTLHIQGDLINNDGDYFVEVNGGGQSDLIAVAGDALIAGGLVTVESVDSTYAFHHRYTIVDAASVTPDGYSGVTAERSLIQPFLSYDPSHVYLTLTTNIDSVAMTHNQHAIAEQLDGITDPTTGQNLLLSGIVNLPSSDVPKVLDALSGYQYTNDLINSMILNRQFIRRLYDPIRSIVSKETYCCCSDTCVCSDDTSPVWFETSSIYARLDKSKNVPGSNMNGYEITAGIQKTIDCDWTVGVAGSYEKDHCHYKHGDGLENNKTWFGGIYGLFRPLDYYALVDLAYSYSKNKMHRKVDMGTLDDFVKGKPNAYQLTLYGEFGIDYSLCEMLIQPFFGIEAGWYRRNHVTETSIGSMELFIHQRDRIIATSRLGLHLTTYELSNGCKISFDLAWDARWTSGNTNIKGRFEEFGGSFDIKGTEHKRSSFDYAITVMKPFWDCWEGYLEGSGESWNNVQLYNVLAGVKCSW